MAVPQLVDFQANHFNFPTWFKQVNHILFSSVDRQVTQPQRVPIRRFHAFGFASQDTARCIRLKLWIRCNLVHVGIIDLDPSFHEHFTLLFHRLVHAMRVLKLNMGKVAADMMIADPHLCHAATVLEEFNDVFFFRPAIRPTYPDGATPFWLCLAGLLSPPRPPLRWRPIAAVAPSSASASAA